MDILFVNPNSLKKNYQGLANRYAAIETPTWSLLLAESCRSKNFKVGILDCNAENLDSETAYNRILKISPIIVCFVVYGQNVNAGTTNMIGATDLSNYIKSKNKEILIGLIGSHIQALPKQTMENEKSFDIGFMNEGAYALHNLLKLKEFTNESLNKINGIIFRKNNEIKFNNPEQVVPQNKMDEDLPGYAWDLLPFKNKPLDFYRAPMWHAEYQDELDLPMQQFKLQLAVSSNVTFV